MFNSIKEFEQQTKNFQEDENSSLQNIFPDNTQTINNYFLVPLTNIPERGSNYIIRM